MILRPLRDDPQQMEKFRRETLYAPLEGTVEAKRSAQNRALAAMGLSLDEVRAAQERRRAEKLREQSGGEGEGVEV